MIVMVLQRNFDIFQANLILDRFDRITIKKDYFSLVGLQASAYFRFNFQSQLPLLLKNSCSEQKGFLKISEKLCQPERIVKLKILWNIDEVLKFSQEHFLI